MDAPDRRSAFVVIDNGNTKREENGKSRLAKEFFVLFCAETIFSLPYRSVYLLRQSVLLASLAAIFVLAIISVCFAFRLSILRTLGRFLSASSIGNRSWVLLWLGIGLILRVGWALRFAVTPKSDHLAYFQLAADMAQGHTGAGAYWPPGFSLFLAPFFMVLGTHLWVALLCAQLFFVATYFLTYALARRIQAGVTGRIAVMLVAIWPGYLTLSGINCKESFLAVLIPAALFLYLQAFDVGSIRTFGPGSRNAQFRWGYLIAAGVCMGFAALTQPAYLLFPAVIFGAEILLGRGVLKASGRTMVFSIAMLAAVLPWSYRNYLVFHRVVLISTNGGSVFYRANNPLANANYAAEGEVALPKDEFAADQLGYKMADEWIEHHPGEFAALMVRKQVVYLGDDALGAYETLKREINPASGLYTPVKAISNLYWLGLWTILFLGFPFLFRQGNWQLWYGLLFLPLVYQWAIDSVFESGPRHHVPYVALIGILVGMVIEAAMQSSSTFKESGSQG